MTGANDAADGRVLRIAVLGAARITPFALLQPARNHPRARVVAVAARDPARARRFAKRHGIESAAATYGDLLHSPHIDAIYNPLPNSHHSHWSIEALKAGKHVLCEKPLAANAADASSMVAARKQSGCVLMEALHWRHTALAARVVSLVSEGTIGTVQHIEGAMCLPLPLPNDIRYQLPLAGGALMDTGVYAASMIRTVALAAGLGEPTVDGVIMQKARADVDRATRATLRFAGGATALLHCSLWSTTLLKMALRVTGSKGSISINNPVLPQVWHKFVLTVDGHSTRESFKGKASSYRAQLDAFIASCLDGAPVLTSAEDAVRTAQLLDAIYQHAGMPVRQPIRS